MLALEMVMTQQLEDTAAIVGSSLADIQRPRVSVIIPTKNEEGSIGNVIQGFREALKGISHEIIVVDDSDDNTPREAVNAGARLIGQVGNGGVGEALLQGFYWARGECVVFVDGDSSYNPHDVHKIVEPLISGEADVVNGNRFADMEPGAMPALNKIGNHLLTIALNVLFRTGIKDSQSGFKGFRREVLQTLPLFERGFSICSEVIAEAAKMGLRIAEVGISYRQRVGKTKLNPVTAGPTILWTTLKVVRDYRPLFIFGPIGLGFIALGFVIAWPIITQFMFTGTFLLLGRALLAVFCWLAGLLLIMTAVILDALSYSIRKVESRIRGQLST